jgi:hypothetical protein
MSACRFAGGAGEPHRIDDCQVELDGQTEQHLTTPRDLI